MSAVDYEPATEPETQHDEIEAADWRYSSLLEWMERWFLPVAFRFDSRQRAWCPEWWRHRYAVERLGALWQAWETMYSDPESISPWWVYHFDAHWAALTNTETGPFRDCGKGHADTAHPLPHLSPPENWPLPEVVE